MSLPHNDPQVLGYYHQYLKDLRLVLGDLEFSPNLNVEKIIWKGAEIAALAGYSGASNDGGGWKHVLEGTLNLLYRRSIVG